jgi:hypothetical protein
MGLTIEKTAFAGWKDAYRLELGKAEMIVLAEVGPRIISLTVDRGPNLLFVDKETRGKGRGDTEWHIYGGHRIWQSPEAEAAYRPDNSPCEVEIGDGCITLKTPVDPMTKLQKRLTISAEGERFVVESALLNTSDFVNWGAVWCLTCVAPTGAIALPWGSPSGTWKTRRITWWTEWAGHTSNVASSQYQPSGDLFIIRPSGEEGKVGAYSEEGWVAQCRSDATLIKSFDVEAGAAYPDDGCSVEVYTSPAFCEMETLTPTGTILPGQEIAQREIWTVTNQVVDPKDGAALRALLP